MMRFRYDREADILSLDMRSPYPEQESEELGDDVVARLHPQTEAVENLAFLFFARRLERLDGILADLPVTAALRLVRDS